MFLFIGMLSPLVTNDDATSHKYVAIHRQWVLVGFDKRSVEKGECLAEGLCAKQN